MLKAFVLVPPMQEIRSWAKLEFTKTKLRNSYSVSPTFFLLIRMAYLISKHAGELWPRSDHQLVLRQEWAKLHPLLS